MQVEKFLEADVGITDREDVYLYEVQPSQDKSHTTLEELQSMIKLETLCISKGK